jgi:hypothetical protein
MKVIPGEIKDKTKNDSTWSRGLVLFIIRSSSPFYFLLFA